MSCPFHWMLREKVSVGESTMFVFMVIVLEASVAATPNINNVTIVDRENGLMADWTHAMRLPPLDIIDEALDRYQL